jgi:DNA invertase Pin-like site-specific DNA recombinase
MIFGYARVSTPEQNPEYQINALLESGIERKNIFTDVASSVRDSRPGLDKLLSLLRKDDIIYVWKMDRIARSVVHFSKLMETLNKNEVQFKSLQEPFIDTTTTYGTFIFNILTAVAQLERDLIIDRTKAALANARLNGRTGGRKSGLSNKSKEVTDKAIKLYKNSTISISEICTILKISKATLYKILRESNVPHGTNTKK